MKTMRAILGSWWGRSLAVLLLAAGAIGFHYTREVLNARAATPGILRAALADPSIVLEPDELSVARRDALLAIQDPRFFEHRGWDFAGGTMTTITQGLVKRYYFDSFRPGLSKIRQSLIARFAMDPLVSKHDQLKLFVNVVYLGTLEGQSVNGLAAGARVFFHRDFRELTWDEYLSLLACFSAPDSLNPRVDAPGNARRVAEIKEMLAQRGIPAEVAGPAARESR